MLIFVRTNDKQTELTLSTMFVMSAQFFAMRSLEEEKKWRRWQQSTSSYQTVVWDEQTQKRSKKALFFCVCVWMLLECCAKRDRQTTENRQKNELHVHKDKWHFDLNHTHLRCWKHLTLHQSLFNNNKQSIFIRRWGSRCLRSRLFFTSSFFTMKHWSRCAQFKSRSLKMQRK